MPSERVILLVEDDPDDVAFIERILKKSSAECGIVVARDGEEAMNCLFGGDNVEAMNEVPQFVLLDLRLPKISGLDVLRRIRSDSRTKLLPVVILSCSDEEKDMLEGYSLGADSYIRKPVSFKELSEVIRQLDLEWTLG